MSLNAHSAAIAAFVGLWAVGSAEAEADKKSPQPFREFTFKRVASPAAGAPRRITVQIAPKGAENTAAPGASAGASVEATVPAPYPWFWAALSPDASEATAGRLFAALETNEAQASAPEPRLQALQDIVARHGTLLLGATVGKRGSPALLLAVIPVESAGDAAAVSRAGAQDLMQLMSATAARSGLENAFDPAQSIAGGVALLDHLCRPMAKIRCVCSRLEMRVKAPLRRMAACRPSRRRALTSHGCLQRTASRVACA